MNLVESCGQALARDGMQAAPLQAGLIDAAFVTSRLEEAGATLLALPASGYSTRLKTSSLGFMQEAGQMQGGEPGQARPAIPSAARITRMDEAFGWISLIPKERTVIRRILGARCLVSPLTERHLFSWRRLGGVLGADHKAVQRWHAQGIGLLVTALRSMDIGRGSQFGSIR